MPYDAFLLVSFGGPEGPEDVVPFLENVTRGRGIPRERLAEVGEHYYRFGGVSPINQQCRDLLAAVGEDFAANGVDLPLYWGNRNWDPYLTDTVAKMRDDGVRHAVAFVTSAYSSISSCRQYLDDIARAREAAGPDAPVIDKLRPFYDHPGFIEPLAEHTRAALAELPEGVRDRARLVFTAHSIPISMARSSGPQGGAYERQLAEAARLVAERVDGGAHPYELVYQSRSGPPQVPWLEPDVLDRLTALNAEGTPAVVLVPVGFVSDHMEVKFDLDVEARELAEKLGMPLSRAAAPGTHPEFVRMVRRLILERDGGERLALGTLPPHPEVCPVDCCRIGR
ncbi:MAG: ferrochelatase [Streptosporangiales bacterium]|nr:ferrochelatase [Streptosporangiales bacterium]